MSYKEHLQRVKVLRGEIEYTIRCFQEQPHVFISRRTGQLTSEGRALIVRLARRAMEVNRTLAHRIKRLLDEDYDVVLTELNLILEEVMSYSRSE